MVHEAMRKRRQWFQVLLIRWRLRARIFRSRTFGARSIEPALPDPEWEAFDDDDGEWEKIPADIAEAMIAATRDSAASKPAGRGRWRDRTGDE